jgi:transcriptional regulator with XRE-family HTH domain
MCIGSKVRKVRKVRKVPYATALKNANDVSISKVLYSGWLRSGLTQRELAEEMGVKEVRLNHWLRGVSKPRADFFMFLIRRLGVVDQLLPDYIVTRRKE